MSLRRVDLEYAKDWRLRAWLTNKNRALSYCIAHPGGLNGMLAESLEIEIKQIRAELAARSQAVRLT